MNNVLIIQIATGIVIFCLIAGLLCLVASYVYTHLPERKLNTPFVTTIPIGSPTDGVKVKFVRTHGELETLEVQFSVDGEVWETLLYCASAYESIEPSLIRNLVKPNECEKIIAMKNELPMQNAKAKADYATALEKFKRTKKAKQVSMKKYEGKVF